MSAKFCARFALKSAVNFELCAPTLSKGFGVEPLRPVPLSRTSLQSQSNFDSGMGTTFCAGSVLKSAANFEFRDLTTFEKMGGGWNLGPAPPQTNSDPRMGAKFYAHFVLKSALNF